jgi:uncharacterized oxidoreductase
MPVFTADHLRRVAADVFVKVGVPQDEADIVSDALVEANLMGHDSHGVIRVMQYVKMIQDGLFVPGAPRTILQERAGSAVLDGGWGLGQVVGKWAAEICIEKAKQNAVASVVVRRCNHVGRLGAYPTMMARQGLIGSACVNACGAAQYMPPWGGTAGRISTNPISYAIPTEEHPIVVDMTSTVVAEGKVRVKLNRGEPCPEGWITDANGNPTTDPKDFYGPPRGAILPIGSAVGHKGFALGLVVEILGGILSGAGYPNEEAKRLGNGCYLTAINIADFADPTTFRAQVSDFVRYMKTSPLAPGFTEILMPGEPEYRQIEKRQREGIFIEDETWRQLSELAGSLGVNIR